jgi:hypothetical protein
MPTQGLDTISLTLMLICHDPPPSEHEGQAMDFGAQDKAGTLHPGTTAPDGTERFRVGVVARLQDAQLDFAGSFVHGPRQGSFLYLGYRPVDATTWTRRWKIPLTAITPALVSIVQAEGSTLQAAFSTSNAVTVQLRGAGWQSVRDAAEEVEEQPFAQMLTGGHPNSLGRTIEVVEGVLAQPTRLAELYACYLSTDAVVRLRTSNALKRISWVEPTLLVPYIDRLLDDVAQINQASAQWTLAQLLSTLRPALTAIQQQRATVILQRNLDHSNDWIVVNMTMQTLAEWATEDAELAQWLRPRLDTLSRDRRKSVAGRAHKLLAHPGYAKPGKHTQH